MLSTEEPISNKRRKLPHREDYGEGNLERYESELLNHLEGLGRT